MIENKKGDISWAVVIGGVIAILVLVFVYLFVSGFFEKIQGPIDTLPSNLALKASACKEYASLEQTIAYCEFTEVALPEASKNSWVNCEYDNANFRSQVGGTLPCIVSAAGFCESKVGDPKFDETYVNGKLCTSLTAGN